MESEMISIIIPTLNEADQLPRTLAAITLNDASEVLVVDGGSNDRTVDVAKEINVRVISSPVRQRAAQLNLGAFHAQGHTLLFLHADTILPSKGLDKIASAINDPKIGGGAFARRFDSPSVLLRITCLAAEIRNRAIGWHLGDQAIFVRKTVFEELGGFAAIDRFEDLDFSRRLGRSCRIVTLRPPVISSARRFVKDGPFRRTWKDLCLTLSYLRAAASPTHFNAVSRATDERVHT